MIQQQLSMEVLKLKKDAEEMYEEARAYRENTLRPKWEEAHRAFVGKHWHGKRIPKWKRKIVFNEVRRVVRQHLPLLTDNNPIMSVFGRGPEDTQTAKLLDDLMKYYWERLHISVRKAMATYDALIFAVGWLKPYIDSRANNGLGDLALDVIDPWHVLMDPNSSWKGVPYEAVLNAEFVIHEHLVSPRELKQRYPDKAEVIDAATFAGREDYAPWTQRDYLSHGYQHRRIETLALTGDPTKKQQIYTDYTPLNPYEPGRLLVKEVYMRGANGPMVITLCEDLVLKVRPDPEGVDGGYPFDHGRIPLLPLVVNPIPGQLYGDGVTEDIYEINKYLNKAWQLIETQQQIYQGPPVFAEEGSLSESGAAWSPGAVNWVEPGRIGGVLVPPLPPIPPDRFQTIDKCSQYIDKISGTTESISGRRLPAGTSGVAVEAVMESALTRIRMMERFNAPVYNEMGRQMISILQQTFNDTGVIYHVLGERGEGQDPFNAIQPGDLGGWFDFILVPQAAHGLIQQIRFKQAMDMRAQNIQIRDERVIDYSEVPDKEAIKNEIKADRESELQMLREKVAQMEQGGPPPQPGGPM